MCFASFGGASASNAGTDGAGSSLLGGSSNPAGVYGSLIASGINAIGGAKSAELNAISQRTELANQAYVANMNAALDELQAQDVIRQGVQAGIDVRQRAKQVVGAQRAAFAANGVKLDEGSPAAVQRSTEYLRDVDVATLQNNAARAAFGYRAQRTNALNRADALNAGRDQISPGRAAATSFLGSASSIADKWYKRYNPTGDKGDAMPTGSSVFSSSGF